MVFKIELAQNSFKDGALLVSNDSDSITCYKYDIRVVANNFNNIGTDAVATNVVINNFTITSTPSSFAIPINAAVMGKDTNNNNIGAKYKVTIRLYSGNPDTPSIYILDDKVFYYDARVYTVSPVTVSSIHSESSIPSDSDPSKFNIANVVLRRDSTALESSDPFFTDVGVSNIVMSCTSIVKTINKFNTGTEYSLGSNTFDRANLYSKSYDFLITPEMNQVETASAYELWGYLTLSSPQFTFGINIVADNATMGYVINNPKIEVELGDVIGAVSENPISVTLTNWSYYNNSTYKFDTLTLEIYDASSNLLLKNALDNPLVYTKAYSNFNANTGVVNFSSSDLLSATNETPLKNGVTYKFKTILNFTHNLLYKPNLVRSATFTRQFTDSLSPINSYGVAVNSWEFIPSKGAGLIVSFRKTDQFYGLSNTNRPYNLEGNTTVTAEYRTFDTQHTPTGEWLGWTALSGGSISQSTLADALDATNTNGVYAVPVYNTDEKRGGIVGSVQAPLYIYAEIPGLQAKYSAVQIRLRLTTTNPVFSSKTSEYMYVQRVNGTTYYTNTANDTAVTFRYHPKPVAHNFTTDKPICTSAGANISFDVPLTVYPFFTAIVTTSEGVCDGSVTNITNFNTYDATSWNLPVALPGKGLSYTPQANATFKLSVKYVSSENSNIYIDTLPMTVKRKGFPSNSFSITNCRWDSVNQEVDYALAISATSTSADRMDGWNLYTKLSSESPTEEVSAFTLTSTVNVNNNGIPKTLLAVNIITDSNYAMVSQNNVGWAVKAKDTTIQSFPGSVYTAPQNKVNFYYYRNSESGVANKVADINQGVGFYTIFYVNQGALDYPILAAYTVHIPNAPSGVNKSDWYNEKYVWTVPSSSTPIPVGYTLIYTGATAPPTDNLPPGIRLLQAQLNPISTRKHTTEGYQPTPIDFVSIGTDSSAPQKVNYTIASCGMAGLSYVWNVNFSLTQSISFIDSAWVKYDETFTSSNQPVSLNSTYADYKNIDIKFVATRSLYLSENEFSNQVETIGAGVRDTKQTPVTKLPAVLPRINSADITLENMVYNVITGGGTGKLSANFPSNAVGLQITDKSDTSPDGIIDNQPVRNIALTNSVVERKYEIKAKYYSVDTPTVQYVYSLPVTVTFKTSTSNRPVPVIKSKSYSNKFTVTYDSANSGDWLNSNTALLSNVYVKKTGLNDSDTLVGSNNGSVDISVFNGDNVDMYVQDEFTTTYTVDNSSKLSVVQLVKSPSVAFVLAANPQIVEGSIVVTNTSIRVDVNNMGTPVLHNAMLVVSQDSTTNENDQGYYALTYFNNPTGFLSSIVEMNTLIINGANAQQPNLSITETGTGMNKVTRLTFSPIALVNANPVNLVLLVRNKTEGSDSCAVANKARFIPPPLPENNTLAHPSGKGKWDTIDLDLLENEIIPDLLENEIIPE